MSTFTPKRKTASGVEDITLPVSAIGGLEEQLTILDENSLAMPRIRVGSVTDIEGTMRITEDNPLIFTVEIIDGKLQVGDQVQICTRQLFTYDTGRRRKMRLRREWETQITEQELKNRFVFVPIAESATKKGQRLFKTGGASEGTKTLSALYVRVRRPVIVDGKEVDGLFSNLVTVWKRYNRETHRIYIK